MLIPGQLYFHFGPSSSLAMSPNCAGTGTHLAVLHISLFLVDQQHVGLVGQPWGLHAQDEEDERADVTQQPEAKLHLDRERGVGAAASPRQSLAGHGMGIN